jgi:DNA-binding MarR family transcriptional regulator
VETAGKLFLLLTKDRQRVLRRAGVTVPAIRLLDQLPRHPIVTLSLVIDILATTKPTASKAIEALRKAKILSETTGKQRDRVYAYQAYLQLLTGGTE